MKTRPSLPRLPTEDLMNARTLNPLAAAVVVICGSALGTTNCFAQLDGHSIAQRSTIESHPEGSPPPASSVVTRNRPANPRPSRPTHNRLFVIHAPPLSAGQSRVTPPRVAPPVAATTARILPATTTPTPTPTSVDFANPPSPAPRLSVPPSQTAGPGRYLVAFADATAMPSPIPPTRSIQPVQSIQPDGSNSRFSFDPPSIIDPTPINAAGDSSDAGFQSATTAPMTNQAADQDDVDVGLENLETDPENESQDATADQTKDQTEDQSAFNDDSMDDDSMDDGDRDNDRPVARQFGTWPSKSMAMVNIDVRDFGQAVPDDESNILNTSSPRYYNSDVKTHKVFAWTAPNIRHQPLYFEDASLERYGQTKGIVKQPFVSAFEFFRDAALLPLNASIDCPHACDTPLGFSRPGSPRTGDCGCQKCVDCKGQHQR